MVYRQKRGIFNTKLGKGTLIITAVKVISVNSIPYTHDNKGGGEANINHAHNLNVYIYVPFFFFFLVCAQCAYWGDKDVGRVFRGLFNAMKNKKKTDEDLCKNITVTDQTTMEANIKACELITASLQHIYGIQEDPSKIYGNQKKNDRIFDQVIACAFLNLYADKMEQQKCIDKNVITDAFSKSEQIKENTPPCNGIDTNCVTCTRDKSYENCPLNVRTDLWTTGGATGTCNQDGTNMKSKMDDMLEKDGTGLKQTLDDICKETSQPSTKDQDGAVQPATEDNGRAPAAPSAYPALSEGEEGGGHSLGEGAGGRSEADLGTPKAAKLTAKKGIDPFLPYFPLAPAVLGISVMSYLVWKYFGMLRKRRKRYRRAYQLRGPSLEQQIVDHVDEHLGPREYILVKERKPRSTPIKRRKKRAVGRRRGVRRRMIIDIHLEVLSECQKGDLHSTKEDFFEILVREFMGSEFIKEENVPKEDIPKGEVPSSDSGFAVPGLGFSEERLCS
ncbi:SICA antigen [Plasmodium coatneyi]|uniref:SICA antigen n=1 Tax=Plasmodium coatneyi TaxID=208452 RepID=A0A1B1DTD9_9APIC|nr:SICA antigen [Plasmodium coatneyi]ANQ05909.1 SICA antigen [Plasmodium coatneyi]